MSCFCFPRRFDKHVYFHWPNFTFAHSQEAINPRRVHNTLKQNNKAKRRLRRRHTLGSHSFLTTLRRRKESQHSLSSARTAPPTTSDPYVMSGKDYSPPPGPPPGYHQQTAGSDHVSSQPPVSWAQTGRSSELPSNNPFSTTHMNVPQEQRRSDMGSLPEYQAPPGPPPGHGDKKASMESEEYAPPTGLPPGYTDGKTPAVDDEYAPSLRPPTHHQSTSEPEPPPYDPWLAVPDTALLPPPPAFSEDKSPASNASWDDAARGREWCRLNPLRRPRRQNQQTLTRIFNGDIRLTAPPNAKHVQLTHIGMGRTRIHTNPKCLDTILLTDIPLYPATTGRPRTVYFELHVLSMGSHGSKRKEEADASIAIGFLAPPYPSWRQPGWHRASLGVHGDDGRRFVDDSFGGRDFTNAFRKHDTVGIGMTFSPPRFVDAKNTVEIFFTRNGKREGGWDLHEEKDRDQDGGDVTGLEGGHDLLGAVGCFGGVDLEVRCRSEDWMFKPLL